MFEYGIANEAARLGWQERDLADDEALLAFLNQSGHRHVDARDGDAWICVSPNASRCLVVDAMIRDGVRRVAAADAAKKQRARDDAERAIAEAKARREAAIAEADSTERDAKEALARLGQSKNPEPAVEAV